MFFFRANIVFSLVLFLLCNHLGYGQNEGMNWHFGNGAGLSFAGGSPTAITSAYLGNYAAGSSTEGVASISDNTGQSLFYTDGLKAYDANNTVMSNGSGLLGNSSSTQSGIIVPKPGSPNQYFIFTVDAFSGSNDVKYSIVDMTLNSGLGDIIIGKKNLNMPYSAVTPSTFTEKLTAVPKAGALGYWLIAHLSNESGSTGTFILWDINCAVNNDGINEHLINGARQSVGSPSTSVYANELGYMKVSPDYSMIAYANTGANFAEVLNFNNTTGVLSNPRLITSSSLGSACKPYGVEFTFDNDYLYISDLYNGPKLMRYDLGQSNLDAVSSYTVYTSVYTSSGSNLNQSGSLNGGWPAYYTLGALQYASDGKIYGAIPGKNHLLKVSNPSSAFPTIVENGITLLPGTYAAAGLPNFSPATWNEGAISLVGSGGCTYTVSLNASLNIPGANYSWDFGNGITSSIPDPLYSYTNTGTYTVNLVITDQSGCQLEDSVEVVIASVGNLGVNSDTICLGETTTLTASGGSDYSWNTGGLDSFIVVSPTSTTIYTVTSDDGQCNSIKTATVTVSPLPAINVASPTVCYGLPTNLTATGASTYSWSDGSQGSSITITCFVDTVFSVVGTNAFNCSSSASSTVTVVPQPSATLINDTVLCNVSNLLLTVNSGDNSVLWSTGSTSSSINVTQSGFYWVMLNNGYCSDRDTVNVTFFAPPNLGPDQIECFGSTVVLSSNLPSGNLWSTGSSANSISVSSSGTFWLESSSGVCNARDSVKVTFVNPPPVDLGNDTSICNTTSITPILLNAGAGQDSYVWNTGASTSTISVSQPGIYWVEVSNEACSSTDSITISFSVGIDLGDDKIICGESEFELSPSLGRDLPGTTYLWSTGETLPAIVVQNPGNYWVMVTQGDCIYTDTLSIKGSLSDGALFVPNSFTPGRDHVNDMFYAEGESVIEFKMMIFNRWGEKVFESNDLEAGWDGNYKGHPVQVDTYVWIIDYKTECNDETKIRKKGIVNVLR